MLISSYRIMSMVTHQLQSNWEKKRKDHEAKFLDVSKAELSQVAADRVEDFTDITSQMDSIYAQFLLEYATVCDDIRRAMVSLLEDQQQLIELVRKKSNGIQEADREREKDHVQGMAVVKKAVQDSNQLLRSLDPGAQF
ncbi:hypothetical protein QCA50_016172 [Cerrena zonata]|uniref:Uncharacterized protein n=1 Tax=Cerrena zonata TaxID=2478898 RepID=A0AAW0FUB4_9APHY